MCSRPGRRLRRRKKKKVTNNLLLALASLFYEIIVFSEGEGEMKEQIKSGSLSFAGLVEDARIAIKAGRVDYEAGHPLLDGKKVRSPRVADAIRFALIG